MLYRRSFLKTATTGAVAALAGVTQTSNVLAHEAAANGQKTNKVPLNTQGQMESRILGKDLKVSAIGLGCPVVESNCSKGNVVTLMHTALDNGITFFSITAGQATDNYGKWVGEALEPVRHHVQISATLSFLQDDKFLSSPSEKSTEIRTSVEMALRNLQTDCLDLLFLPQPNNLSEIAEVAGAAKDLISEGKVLHWGLVDAEAEAIREAQAICPLTAYQSEYAIWSREPERKLFTTLEAFGIGLVAYGSLSGGRLTGDGLQEWSERKEMTPAQFALAWMLSRKPWIVPIPQTTNPEHLRDISEAGTRRLAAWELEEFDKRLAG